MLGPLLSADPATPRFTIYDDARGIRMDFSAQTLDNWASKVANMLDEEFDLSPDASIVIDLPVSWQAAVIAVGTFNSSRTPLIDDPATAPDIVFTTPERADKWTSAAECVLVSDDPFGRGIVEAGGTLPPGTVDFGPTVRFYGDAYFGISPELSTFAEDGIKAERYLVQGWQGTDGFRTVVLAPLAAGGSVVAVTGLASADRLKEITDAEKVTRVIEQQ